MIRPLPPWLLKRYTLLLSGMGFLPFKVADARVGDKRYDLPLTLSRLGRFGWAERLGRGEYRIIHPTICTMESSVPPWREKVRQKDRLPVLELAVARLIEEFRERLVSIVLFGSLARGESTAESDIDLLLVAEGLPKRYGERVEKLQSLLAWRPIEEWIIRLWTQKRIYPNLQTIAITPAEAKINQPFFLDMVNEGVIIYDRDSFISQKLSELRAELARVGVTKVSLPEGTSYWVLTRNSSDAREARL